jgi:hypothetical protein
LREITREVARWVVWFDETTTARAIREEVLSWKKLSINVGERHITTWITGSWVFGGSWFLACRGRSDP